MQTPTWEYRSLKFQAKGFFVGGRVDIAQLDTELNQLGAQGWELVSVFDSNMAIHGATREIVATLKRRRG
jgi:hypothetical protein